MRNYRLHDVSAAPGGSPRAAIDDAGSVGDDAGFRRDLFRGAAADYERHRPGYPPTLVEQLLADAGVSGSGRAVDLACGTGQIAFAVAGSFAEVLAVDQEAGMVDVVRRTARPGDGVRAVLSAVEELDLSPGSVELVTIGNAFHRLPRARLARQAARWLVPGGCLALVWSDSPWTGELPWQRVLLDTVERWSRAVDPVPRVPDGWQLERARVPDAEVLEAAGLVRAGGGDVRTERSWTVADLVGFAHSTSLLPRRDRRRR